VPTAGGGEDDTLSSTCGESLEQVCEWLHCGEPWSPFDEAGCYRGACFASSECASDQRCVAPPLLGRDECVPSGYTDLSLGSDCECNFGVTGDCATHGYCLSEADFPAANDCDTREKSCDDLEWWLAAFGFYDLPSSGDTTDLQDALSECRAKIENALTVCDGGAAGSGGAGAPPG
jgi:hypothetical protein